MLTYIISGIIAAISALGGYAVGGGFSGGVKSGIEKRTTETASKTALYALCIRAATAKEARGQNIRDCDKLMDDITTSGRLKNYESCANLNKRIDEKLDCRKLVLEGEK